MKLLRNYEYGLIYSDKKKMLSEAEKRQRAEAEAEEEAEVEKKRFQ